MFAYITTKKFLININLKFHTIKVVLKLLLIKFYLKKIIFYLKY